MKSVTWSIADRSPRGAAATSPYHERRLGRKPPTQAFKLNSSSWPTDSEALRTGHGRSKCWRELIARDVLLAVLVAGAVTSALFWMEDRREDARLDRGPRADLAVRLALTDSLTEIVLTNQEMSGIGIPRRNLSDANLRKSVLQDADLGNGSFRVADLRSGGRISYERTSERPAWTRVTSRGSI